MTQVLTAIFGALIVVGLLGAGMALRPQPVVERREAPRTPSPLMKRMTGLSSRTRAIALGSLAAGVLVAMVTGWMVAVVVLPAAALGLPYLLSAPPTAARIRRVEAMEEWTRSLSGVLGAGVGLEQAIAATLRSTPDVIKPEVTALVARLRARWDTETALRAFADDLGDVTGDLVATNLILAARRRNRSLASALRGVAESVAEDVAARRRIEAGRAKPRGSARLVTLISFVVLTVLALTGDYVAPYRTPVGQLVLMALLGAYAGCLLWMRKMSDGKSFPRFLGAEARAGAR